jgi:hypothetical protein
MDTPKKRSKHMRQAAFKLLQLRQRKLVAMISDRIRVVASASKSNMEPY